MRNTFINTLCDLAAVHEDIFLVCGDLGYSVLEPFAERFPDRYINAGIAEQNMTGLAAGLAMEGYNVFTYSIGNFPTLRCLEQIRYDVCYHKANVKIVAVGSGYAYGAQGVSHHTTEDLAVLRALPGMVLCTPADAIEARAAAHFMATHKGPGYVRLNKAGEALLHPEATSLSVSLGTPIKVKDGHRVAVLSSGAITGQVAAELDALGHGWALFSLPFAGHIKPDILCEIVRDFEVLVTVEEHQRNGGVGGAIIETLSDLHTQGSIAAMPKVHRIAIANTFIGAGGSQEFLRAQAGLSLSSLPPI